MKLNELSAALEAILFVAGDSMEIERLAMVLDTDSGKIEDAALELGTLLEEQNRGLRLIRLESRLQLVTAPAYSEAVIRAMEKRKTGRLSPAALEVLSIVAYHQPVTRSYIEKVRGVDSSYTVSFLTDRGFIEPKGKLEAPGRPTLFGTTEEFLRVMGLRSLDELPPLPNIAEDEGRAALRMAIEEKTEHSEE